MRSGLVLNFFETFLKSLLFFLQIGTMNGQAYIFDLLSDSSVLMEGKLKKILESEEIVKV